MTVYMSTRSRGLAIAICKNLGLTLGVSQALTKVLGLPTLEISEEGSVELAFWRYLRLTLWG